MQSGRTIHYKGNSVSPARPSRANLARRKAREANGTNELKIVDSQRKTCATLECVWCGAGFDDYAIRCRVCGLCQYCGVIAQDSNGCSTCANILPEELKPNEPLTETRRVRA